MPVDTHEHNTTAQQEVLGRTEKVLYGIWAFHDDEY
jgi:hypothetical protein